MKTRKPIAGRARERRRSFRVNDQIGLRVKQLTGQELAQALKLFESERRRFGLANEFAHRRERSLPTLKPIEMTHPDIAAYLEHLEHKIDSLAAQLGSRDAGLSIQPSHAVNISSHGLCFYHDHALSPGAALELHLKLFPTGICLLAYGTVIWCGISSPAPGHASHAVAVDFSHIHGDDRDLLIKHILEKELAALRSGCAC
jgi:hypothetical protein